MMDSFTLAGEEIIDNTAERNAALVLEIHSQQITSAVFKLGQESVVDTIHALADLIEASEFQFQTTRVH